MEIVRGGIKFRSKAKVFALSVELKFKCVYSELNIVTI